MNRPALSISEVSFVESTCKHNILLSCPSPNASNGYGVFLFVASKSLVPINIYRLSSQTSISWYNSSCAVCDNVFYFLFQYWISLPHLPHSICSLSMSYVSSVTFISTSICIKVRLKQE